MKWIGRIFKLFTPFLGALLGLVIANKYNFFATLPFVPKESAYDICIAVYFAIADLLMSEFIELVKNKIEKNCSIVEVLVSIPNIDANLSTCPTISFNSAGMAEMEVIVRLVGKKEHFKDTKITLCDTGFITLQPSIHSSSISIAANGDCVIDLSALTGNASIIDIKQSFRIVMQENVPDGSRTMSLKPNINRTTLFLKYSCNHAIIRVEGR